MFVLLQGDDFERSLGYHTFAIVVVLLLSLAIGYALHKYHFYYLPESAGSMLVGLLAGTILYGADIVKEDELVFSSQLFFFVLLPPIILEAGYTLKTGPFFENFGGIVILAVLGTIVAAFVTATGIYIGVYAKLNPLDSVWQGNDFMEMLLFGTLLSAVDPIATLAILGAKDVGAPVMLYSLVFGESVLNDAVTIVLFNTIEPFIESGGQFVTSSIFIALGKFFGICFGSIILGIVCGLICSLIFKKAVHLEDVPESEFLIMFLFCYGSYGIASWIGLSGIMTIFCCGITLGRYAFKAASESAKWSTTLGFKAIAVAADTFVFVYLGIQLSLALFNNGDEKFLWNFPFILWVICWCFLARAIQLFSLVALANIFRTEKIPFKMQLVMWFAGLRGAIAFALALNFPNPTTGPNNFAVVKTVTLCVVIFTTFVCGGLTEPMVSKLGMKNQIPKKVTKELSGFAQYLYNFDKNVLQPAFAVPDQLKYPMNLAAYTSGEAPIDANYKMVRRTTQEFATAISRRLTIAAGHEYEKPRKKSSRRPKSEGGGIRGDMTISSSMLAEPFLESQHAYLNPRNSSVQKSESSIEMRRSMTADIASSAIDEE